MTIHQNRGVATRPVTAILGRGALNGALAGAAATTALNAITFCDMALRGRPASTTPQQSVERGLRILGMEHVLGSGPARSNRLDGLGSLTGSAAGVGVGMVLGVVQSLGVRPRLLPGALLATAAALLPGNLPMAVMGVSDPRSWSRRDWAADLVPHLAYGLVAEVALDRLRTTW